MEFYFHKRNISDFLKMMFFWMLLLMRCDAMRCDARCLVSFSSFFTWRFQAASKMVNIWCVLARVSLWNRGIPLHSNNLWKPVCVSNLYVRIFGENCFFALLPRPEKHHFHIWKMSDDFQRKYVLLSCFSSLSKVQANYTHSKWDFWSFLYL